MLLCDACHEGTHDHGPLCPREGCICNARTPIGPREKPDDATLFQDVNVRRWGWPE